MRALLCLLLVAPALLHAQAPAPVYDVRAYGARGDGTTLDTENCADSRVAICECNE